MFNKIKEYLQQNMPLFDTLKDKIQDEITKDICQIVDKENKKQLYRKWCRECKYFKLCFNRPDEYTEAVGYCDVVKHDVLETSYCFIPMELEQLEKENADLKKQLNQALNDIPNNVFMSAKGKEFDDMKSKISKLEKNEEIYHKRLKDKRDKIIRVLKSHLTLHETNFVDRNVKDTPHDTLNNKTETIADEIIGGGND